jgi:transcriptional regulator with XRE-family HTH domain
VPRKKPVSENDLAIARRLKQLRIDCQFSRQELAERSQTPFGVITRVELGIMPLRYFDARRLLRGLSLYALSWLDLRPVNPLWLAEGEEPMQVDWPLLLPASRYLGVEVSASFSAVIKAHRSVIAALVADPSTAELPESWLAEYLNHWDILQGKADQLRDDAITVGDLFLVSAQKLAPQSARATEVLKRYHVLLAEAPHKRPLERQKKLLHDITVSGKYSGVKSPMKDLLKRLNQATRLRGAKSQLAAHMNVPLVNVSQWLSERREPSGEKTLKLLHWVEMQEHDQNKSPGDATTSPEPKTQTCKSSYEKHRSGQKKG